MAKSLNFRRYTAISKALKTEAQLYQSLKAGELDFGGFAWASNQSLVVPRKFAAMENYAASSRQSSELGWPVHLRPTGGGTSPQGPGIVNLCIGFSLPASNKLSIHEAYSFICDPIIAEIGALGANAYCDSVEGAFCDGAFNVVVNGKKIVGTAQRWGKTRLGIKNEKHVSFVHAVILYSANLPDSVNAINRFHQAIGYDVEVSRTAQANLSQITPLGDDENSISEFTNRLMERCRLAWLDQKKMYKPNHSSVTHFQNNKTKEQAPVNTMAACQRP